MKTIFTNKLLILLLVFSSLLFLYDLNSTHLTNWDEAWHAVIARNMARSNDFVTPTYNGSVWFATAPFYLWLLAIWFKLTNYNTLGVRLFSALFGISTIFVTYLIGNKLKNKSAGTIAAFILTTTIQFLFRSRQGNLDSTLTFFNTLAVYSFLMGRQNPKWYLGIGLSAACGFLTKSLLGLFPLALFLFIPIRWTISSLAIFLLVTLPWHTAAYYKHGMAFINHYLLQYALSKATNANPVSGTQIFWYVGVLKHGLKMWFIIFIPSLFWTIYKLFFKKNLLQFKPQLHYLIPLAWTLIPLLLLTIARMRNDWYIISLYPGIALLTAISIQQLISALLKKSKFINNAVLSLVVIGSGAYNAIRYRDSYIVPDTTKTESQLATLAKQISDPKDKIMLDDNYLPVSIFYSDRSVIPLRFSRAYESLVSQASLNEATQSGARLVLTNAQTIDQLLESLDHPKTTTISSLDDKILIKLEYPDD